MDRQGYLRMTRHWLSAPFIWALAIPLLVLDIFAEIYHRISFPLYGIPYVTRSRYFRFDRAKLPYLNIREKICCAYCSYANGLLGYVFTIAGKTEEYFCAIKHDKYKNFIAPPHHKNFVRYGDKKGFSAIKKQ